MKILICADSEIQLQLAGTALEAAGHEVTPATDPSALAGEASLAQVLLVDQARGGRAAALLRDRGFQGKAFLLAGAETDESAGKARALQLDGALAAAPPEELPGRLARALERRRKVLIVDDSEIVARLLAEELSAKGFAIDYAPDAEKATSIILKRATRPDLILLDINMPRVDGAAFCRFVKKNPQFRGIKVLFCSGERRERVTQLVEECGADGYILKDEFLGKWIVDNAV
jgi:CheY-like chemotaxis protein